MRRLLTYPLLFCAVSLLTGFSWGFDPCKNALELANDLAVEQNDLVLRQTEAKILSQCPDGAAANFVNAVKLERAGNIEGAISEYRQALRIDPTFARASGNLGLLYAQKGMDDEASVELTRGLSAIQNPLYNKTMARILAQRKVYPLAIYHYSEAASKLTEDASVFAGLAEIYSATGQPEKALEEYRRALTANPAFEKAYLESASIYLQQKKPDLALAMLKKAETVNPQNREVHLALAGIYESKGDAKQADYHSLLAGKPRAASTSPPKPTAPTTKATSSNGIDEIKTALRENPNDVSNHEKLGKLYQAAGKDAEALDSYREAAHLNSNSYDVHLNLGILYEKAKLQDEAVVAYKKAIKVSPANAEAHLRLGDIRYSRGVFPEAVEHYSQFLKLKPESPDIHLKLARIFAKNKETGLAISSYNSVLKYSPNDVDANREIAAVYRAKGDNDKSVLHFRKVLELRKDDAESRTALVSIYVKNKQYDELGILLKEAVEINPEDPNNHYKLGLIHDFKKDYESAEASYKKSIELKPDHARSLNALGRLYMKAGKLNEAKETLEAAKKADPSMEETSILLSNIRDEFNPEPRKITKGKKSKLKKGKTKKGKKSKDSKASKNSKKSVKSGSKASKKQ